MRVAFALTAALVLAPPAAMADQHLYSYEAVSAPTKALAPTGLSFQFDRRPLGGVTVEKVIQTGERGEAEVRPAGEGELGAGGLKTALDGARPAGRLYRIEAKEDGDAFVGAVCPGAEKAWLVIGPFKRFEDLKVQAVGRDKGSDHGRLCVTLDLSFRAEWQMPQRAPPRVRFKRNLP